MATKTDVINTARLPGVLDSLAHRRKWAGEAVAVWYEARRLNDLSTALLDIAYEQHTDGELARIYIGHALLGIIAQYDCEQGHWYLCHSHGNYGKNVACGGTWHGVQHDGVPPLVTAIMTSVQK
jgi:hypothetical protein|nr:MAG TPA: hypothetical protein [Caudoviricetes sp.]